MEAYDSRGLSVAFFDVDETLLDGKSMALFLDYAAERIKGLPSWYEFWNSLDPAWDRERGNREYYYMWRGKDVAHVRQLGYEWFRAASVAQRLIPSTVRRLHQHHAAGHRVVMVTGSFDAPITPLSRLLHCDSVLQTELGTENGCYTGVVTRSMIGDHKARAAMRYLESLSVSPERVWAYGDHPSDLPLLQLAAHRYMVIGDSRADEMVTAKGVTRIRYDDLLEEPHDN